MIKRIGSTVFIIIMLAACGTSPQPAAQIVAPGQAVIAQQSQLLDDGDAIPQAGEVAPDFRFTLPDGTTTKLNELRGKKVLINFWATWCGPCQEEMPDLQQAHEQAGDDLVIIGVNKAEDAAAVASFVKDVPVTFPLVLDPDSDIAYRYGARNLPMSFFVNTDGTINMVKLGIMDEAFIEQQVQALK